MTVMKTAKTMIIPVGLALCMVGLTACKCPRSKAQAQAAPPVTEPSGAPSSAPMYTGPAATEMQEANIPLHEERLSVSKQSMDSGQVRLRKIVRTEQVSQPVELRKDSLEIIREPAGSSTMGGTNETKLFESQDIVIRLQEEQPVLQKQVVQTGTVVAKKNTQTEQRTVTGEIRKEDIQVDRSGSQANVTYKGQINEAAGATSNTNAPNWQQQQQQQQQQDQQNSQQP